MKLLRIALSYLTILPVGGSEPSDPSDFARSRPWFPAAGLFVGLVWGGAGWLLHRMGVPTGVSAAILLATPLLLTGFLHLDGLLDSADALLGPRTPQRRLEILKDVHLGSFAFGVGGIWMIGTWQILTQRTSFLLLLLLPVLSRASLAGWTAFFPYARSSGISSRFGDRLQLRDWILLAAWFAPCLVLFPRETVVAVLCQFLAGIFAASRLGGGITGDVYGAMLCLSESAALLSHIPWSGK